MKTSEHATHNSQIYIFALLSLILLISLYTLSRYAGSWSDGDTASITQVVRSNLASGKLIPETNVYVNGYGYQVLALTIIDITGISLSHFQAVLSVLLAIWVVVPAWLAYRELLRSEIAASLATLILLIEPEFLFPMLRGTHEKFTRGLMFICLFLLCRSLRTKTPRQLAPLAICFYLSAYAMISFNTFLATSFILALIVSLGLLWIANWVLAKNQTTSQSTSSKLLFVTTSLLVIAFLFTFYAYPPATHQVRVLQSVWDQLALLFLQVEETSINPYQVVNAGWISLPVYFLVSLANWLLIGVTIPFWIRQTYTWFVKRNQKPNRRELALWAFFAAFALLGGISILVDLSGAIASNLQHRMFPSFTMLAAPVASAWLISRKRISPAVKRFFQPIVSIALGSLMVLAILKATDEPILSNYWLFTTTSEQIALGWCSEKLESRSIWTGLDRRISNWHYINNVEPPHQVKIDPGIPEFSTHNFIVSEANVIFALRIDRQLPIQADDLITYDNGETQIYHRRPQTPFQK
jgi:hypothetical protein